MKKNSDLRFYGALSMLWAAAGLVTPAQADMPSVETVIAFTGSIASGGNGAYPPNGNASVSYPVRVFVEDSLGYLYGSTAYGGGFEPGAIGYQGNGGEGELFYRYRPDVGQEILDRSVQTGNSRPAHLGYVSNDYFYSTEGGLRRWTGSDWTVLADIDGNIAAPWVEGSDGRLYNSNRAQTIYVTDAEGASGISTLLDVPSADGRQLTLFLSHSDGRLYGAGRLLSSSRWRPLVFSVRPDGTDYTLVATNIGDGDNASGGQVVALLEHADGTLYGATLTGGANNNGVLFRVGADGSGYTVLHEFGPSEANTDGVRPGSLTWGHDGHLYGTADRGGIHRNGVIFRWNTQTEMYEPLYAFSPLTLHDAVGKNTGHNSDGIQPHGLMTASDGTLYGMASLGGEHGWGTVFAFHPGDEVPVFRYQPNITLGVRALNNIGAGQLVETRSIALGSTLQFYWSGELIDQCAASSDEAVGAWTGARSVSASEDPHTPAELGAWTYTLTCESTSTDFPQPVTASLTVDVVPVTPASEKGGNGGVAPPWLLLGLLALAGRRRRR